MNKQQLCRQSGIFCLTFAVIAVTLILGYSKPAPAAITLKAVSFLPTNISTVRALQIFADRVNQRAKGELVIKVVGGPEIIAGPDQPEAVRTGAIDMALVVASVYPPTLQESRFMYLQEYTLAEQRQNGYYDWMVQLHKEKMNAYYLGECDPNTPFCILTKFPVRKPRDFAGHKAASHPTFNNFASALKIVPISIPPEERFTALQQGLCDVAFSTTIAAFELGYGQATKYLIDHGFWRAGSFPLIMNLDAWNRLPRNLQDLMNKVKIEMEPELESYFGKAVGEARQKLLDGGLTAVKFSPEDAKWFVDLATSVEWELAKSRVSPEAYAKMRKLMVK